MSTALRAETGEVAVGVQGLPKSGPQVVGILQARHGRSSKPELGQNSPNLGTTLSVTPVGRDAYHVPWETG